MNIRKTIIIEIKYKQLWFIRSVILSGCILDSMKIASLFDVVGWYRQVPSEYDIVSRKSIRSEIFATRNYSFRFRTCVLIGKSKDHWVTYTMEKQLLYHLIWSWIGSHYSPNVFWTTITSISLNWRVWLVSSGRDTWRITGHTTLDTFGFARYLCHCLERTIELSKNQYLASETVILTSHLWHRTGVSMDIHLNESSGRPFTKQVDRKKICPIVKAIRYTIRRLRIKSCLLGAGSSPWNTVNCSPNSGRAYA